MMGGSIGKLLGTSGGKSVKRAVEKPAEPVVERVSRTEQVAAARRRARGTGYRGLLGGGRLGAGGTEEQQTTLGVSS
tara:strand:- start:4443 stop:4673 length:231 start_codon:yes stop_codon:yes gene_type:complete